MFSEGGETLLVTFVFDCVLVNKGSDALFGYLVGENFRAESKEFIKDGEDLIVQAVRHVVKQSVEHVEEEELQIRVVGPEEVSSLDVCESQV